MVDKISSSLLLPAELKHYIAALCSPLTLASLARTHTFYKVEAEQALYHTISLLALEYENYECLSTLASHPEKAAYVRVLTLHCTHSSTFDFRCECGIEIMPRLLKGLVNMHALYDFRLSTLCRTSQAKMVDLDKILCGGHFRLKTLYCRFGSPSLDIFQIIKNQPELQILGAYGPLPQLPRTLQQLHNLPLILPLILPMVLVLGAEQSCARTMKIEHIRIFPAFYSTDRIAMIPQMLVESLDQDKVYCGGEDIAQFDICLVDSSDMATIPALAKAIAVSFPHIAHLSFHFEDQCIVSPQEMKKIIFHFSKLRRLHFAPWPPRYRRRIAEFPEDIRKVHVKDWTGLFPGLVSVTCKECPFFKLEDVEYESDEY